MLDDDQRIARFDEQLEDGQQTLYVGQMQPDGRFVEDEQRASRCFAAQFLRQFEALDLPIGQRRRGLPEAQVGEPDVAQGFQADPHLRNVVEQGQRLGHGHLQSVGNAVAAESYRQGIPVVASPAADVAGHVHVRQKVHFDREHAVPFARLAAPALDVEREPVAAVAAHPRIGQPGVQAAQRVEQPGVRGRGGRRRASDGRAVHRDDLVHVLPAGYAAGARGGGFRAGQRVVQRRQQRPADQRTLARTRHPADARQRSERQRDAHVFQVVAPDARQFEPRCRGPAAARYGDLLRAGQEAPGDGFRGASDVRERPRGADPPAPFARLRAQVDHVIRGADSLRVVFDDHDRIAAVAQPAEQREQSRGVARVQADRRLVQHVHDPGQTVAQQIRQPDALHLAPRQRRHRPVERYVAESQFDQRRQPRDRFVQQRLRDLRCGAGQRERGKKFGRLRQRPPVQVGQADSADHDAARLGANSAAVTGFARARLRFASLRTSAARCGLGQPHAEPVAVGTRPLRAVGRKERRAELGIRELALRTHQPLREAPLRCAVSTVVDQDVDHVPTVTQRGIQRVGQPRRNVGFDDQSVDDDLQHVSVRLRVGPCRRSRWNLVGQIVNLPIDTDAHEPRAAQFLKRCVAFLPAVGP